MRWGCGTSHPASRRWGISLRSAGRGAHDAAERTMDLTDTAQSDAKYEWLSAVIGLDLRGRAGRAGAPGAAGQDVAPAGGSAAESAPGGPGGPAPVAVPETMSPTGMKDEDIAAEIMDK